MKWLDEVQNQHISVQSTLSFEEYMVKFEASPLLYTRNTAQYFKDLFDHLEKNEEGGYKFFSEKHVDAPPVYGQFKTQKEIYNNIKNFIEEGFNNKFLLLLGPNGSSKSSIVKKIMKAAERYSNKDEGALHSFSWIFPIDSYMKGSLALGQHKKAHTTLPSYAKLGDNEIASILTSELKDHPILLIPKTARRNLIDKLLADQPEKLFDIKKTYLYNGELSKRNQMVFDALLSNYQDDYSQVYKHIRVERFYVNKRQSSSAVTIEPQMHVDATIHQITMDKRMGSLPASLQSLNLFSLGGEMVMANRGVIEYSDLLKRPVDAFKYLLTTMETKNVNLKGILTELDTFFVGTSNELHFSQFKQNPDYKSFKGRFNIIKVPYLLQYAEEMKIYADQIQNLSSSCTFEPHAIEALCMWSIMTRLRAPEATNYSEPKMGEVAASLTPLEKTLLYNDQKIPERLDIETKKSLKRDIDIIYREYANVIPYEGMFGASPREIKKFIYKLAERNTGVTFIEVIDLLKNLITKKAAYDFLNITPIGDYHDPAKFIDAVETHCLNSFDNELRDSLGLVDNRSYEEYIEKYVLNVKADLKNEKIKNSITGQSEEADRFFIQEFEKSIGLKDSTDQFRSDILTKMGAYSLDNPGEAIVYTEIFHELAKLLRESFRKDQRAIISKVNEGLVYYKNENSHEKGKIVETVITNLCEKYHYSKRGALELVQFLISKRYQ